MSESHVSGGTSGLAAGSTSMLPPPAKRILYRSSHRQAMRSWFTAVVHVGTTKRTYPQTAIDNRLHVAILHFAETGISTALPAPPWKGASRPRVAHGRVAAVCSAGLEPCGRGCIHHAPAVLHGAAVCTHTYLPLCPEMQGTVYFQIYS